jgi:hypothetical protein
MGVERKVKLASRDCFFAVQCPKIIGRGKKRVAEYFGLRNAVLYYILDPAWTVWFYVLNILIL